MAKDHGGRNAKNVASQPEADNKTVLPSEADSSTFPSSSSLPPSVLPSEAVSSAGPGVEASTLLIAQDRRRRMSLDQEHRMAFNVTMESDNGVGAGSETSQDPALDAFRAMERAALKSIWSEEVEEDEEFMNSEFFGGNIYGLLAEGASTPVAAPQAPRKKDVKPDCVSSTDKNPDNFIHQSTEPPNLFDPLMTATIGDLFPLPESECLDTAPPRLTQEEQRRRSEQLEQDLLSVADARQELNRRRRRRNLRGPRGRGNWGGHS